YVVVASLVVIISLVLYKFALYAFLKAYGLSETSYKDIYVGWKDYDRTIDVLFRYYKKHFTGTGFYGEKVIVSLWFVIPFLVFVFIKKGGVRLLCAGLLLLAGIAFSPFALSLILGSPLPSRTLLALPFMVGGIWYLASLNVGVKVRYLFLLVAVFIALNNSFMTTRLFYADYLTWQADRDFANRILDRMYDVGIDYDPSNPIPVTFIGEKGYTSNAAFFRSEVFGSSFFQWDHGNTVRIVAFMKTLGADEFVRASYDKQAIAIKESKTMKKWPHRGSILYKDGMLIIKIGEPTFRQLSLTQKYHVN
ncbi:MAG: hypothetical protein IH823_08880, partial [Candidatus Dadabacteria bacterium]|nr:hypothetical protein [Candidatus Dadabacteria bacterium]